MKFKSRTTPLGAAALGLTVLGAGAVSLSANPATAAGIITAVTTVSCSVTGSNWCISGNNSSSGIGVIGTSKSGTGLRGTSTSQYGLKATSVSGTAIFAETTSGSTAISATADGKNYTGAALPVGISGNSPGGYGVLGNGSQGIGVGGMTNSGEGVYGSATGSGSGGYFASYSGYGVFAQSDDNVAFVGRTTKGNASDIQGSHIGLLGRAPTSGFPLVATDANANTLFYVDGYGNVGYSGSLYPSASIVGGGKARSFSPKSALPTIEDAGTAQLVSGVAVVRLDPTFAASMDRTTAYRVFVTPAGDTRGLFVASRTPAEFVVRESQGGRSTVAFDYRVLATALGQTGQRMSPIDRATSESIPRAPLPVLRSAPVPPPVKLSLPAPTTP